LHTVAVAGLQIRTDNMSAPVGVATCILLYTPHATKRAVAGCGSGVHFEFLPF